MDNERYQVVYVDGLGYGVIKEQNAHYAVVELREIGHRWTVVVPNDEYEYIEEINIGHEELE